MLAPEQHHQQVPATVQAEQESGAPQDAQRGEGLWSVVHLTLPRLQ